MIARLAKHGWWCPLLLGVLLLGAPAGVEAAESQTVEITSIRLGFDGKAKVGYWIPLQVSLRGGAESVTAQVEVTVPDSDGTASRVSSRGEKPVLLSPGQESTVLLYVKLGRLEPTITVDVKDEEETIATRTFEIGEEALDGLLPADKQLIVSLGEPIGITEAIKLRGQNDWEDEPVVEARLSDASQLPTRWYGYDGVDVVVLSTSDASQYRDLTGDSARATALDTWVRRGGKLILCVGKEAPEVLDSEHGLAQFSPGEFAAGDMAILRSSAAIEEFAFADYSGTHDGVSTSAAAGFRLDVPRIGTPQGRVLMSDGLSLPLAIRTARDFGQVIFVALDLDRPPLSRWSGRGRLVAKLLDFKIGDDKTDAQTNVSQFDYWGYDDHVGQLRSGLDEFPGVRVLPFSVITGLLIFYIILIGPVDYFFVKKYFKKMHYTWITFPATVITISVVVYLLAYWLKGSEVRLNQIDVVDLNASNGAVRGTTWMAVYSPHNVPYDLTLRPDSLSGTGEAESDVVLSWLGLPGDALGGMQQNSRGGMFSAYDCSPTRNQLENVPIPVWSSKMFTARWGMSADMPIEGQLSEAAGQLLRGTVSNPLDLELTDCVMLYADWAYPLDKVRPHEEIVFDEELSPKKARTYLQRGPRRSSKKDYDPEGKDLRVILRAMMFHDLAGGRSHTSLVNQYQRFIDMSALLKSGQAVLVGYGPAGHSAATLLNDSEPVGGEGDQRLTVYRVVFPVARGTASTGE
jgi:hypothetical protein